MGRLLDYLPRGDMVDDASWRRRHHFLVAVLASLCPALLVFGLVVGSPPSIMLIVAAVPVVTAAGGWLSTGRRAGSRRVGSLWVTAGLTACCAGLVILAGGAIEAHFSFFVIIGFLTLYQHWLPFVWNTAFTVLSHGLGSLLVPTMIFNHHMGQHSPWLWSLVHGVAVLLACVGVMLFCRITEQEQARRAELSQRLADTEVRQQEFTSQLLLNLARRNQSMYGRQLDIINDLEERERDPDVLAELFRLDHLATRVRRNAESLLVLSGATPARVWTEAVPLRDVVRAGIAETEDLARVAFSVDEQSRVVGGAVADVTHVVAELVENAARFSPPTAPVQVEARAHHRIPGAQLLVVEDTGVGMPAEDRDAANELLAAPTTVDVAASRRLGFHVVSRLAARHGIEVSLSTTPGGGITAVLVLPAALFADPVAVATHPLVLPRAAEGRHGLPGDVGYPDPEVPADTVGAADAAPVEEVAADGRAGHHRAAGDLETGGRRRRSLIHPIVVPPPRLDGSTPSGTEDGVAAPQFAPAPREPGDSTVAPENGAGAGEPVLRRRVPQTHLAPELMHRTAANGSAPAGALSTAPAPRTAPEARDGTRPGHGLAGAGPLAALSRYQASREAARTELDADEPGDGPAGDHDTTHHDPTHHDPTHHDTAAPTGPAGGRA